MSLSITIYSTREFRRLSTSGKIVAKLADNDLVSTGSQYSSTNFQSGKGMSPSSSLPHDLTDAYKASIFSGFMASPPPVGNNTLSFLILYFSSLSVSSVLTSSVILDGDLPAPQCWPGIWRWCITVFFIYTLLLLLILSFIFYCFPWIETGNETGSPSDVLGDPLTLCGTIISSLKCSPRSPLTKEFLSVTIEDLIVCRNGHENMVLHANPSNRARETVTGFSFTTKGFL